MLIYLIVKVFICPLAAGTMVAVEVTVTNEHPQIQCSREEVRKADILDRTIGVRFGCVGGGYGQCHLMVPVSS